MQVSSSVYARQKRETDVQLLVTVSCEVNVTKAIHKKNSAIRNPPSMVILTMNVSRSDTNISAFIRGNT